MSQAVTKRDMIKALSESNVSSDNIMTTEGRGADGKFKKGNTCGKGRRGESLSKSLRILREAAQTIALPYVIERAKDGDMEAVKIILTLGLPVTRPSPALEKLPFPEGSSILQKAKIVYDAAASGTISGSSAEVYMSLLQTVARLEEMTVLQRQEFRPSFVGKSERLAAR